MKCNCHQCKLARWCISLKRRIPKADRQMLEELWIAYETNGMDAAYWEAKYKGTWSTYGDPKTSEEFAKAFKRYADNIGERMEALKHGVRKRSQHSPLRKQDTPIQPSETS